MTKIPLEILHFCETTNSGHNGNMPFLVLQVDGLLEGPSIIHIRLCKSLRIVRLALRIGSVSLCVQPRHTSHSCQPKSCIHAFVIRNFLVLAPSEAPSYLYHPKLLRTCTSFPATKYKRRSIFSSKGTFGPNSSPSRDKFIYRK